MCIRGRVYVYAYVCMCLYVSSCKASPIWYLRMARRMSQMASSLTLAQTGPQNQSRQCAATQHAAAENRCLIERCASGCSYEHEYMKHNSASDTECESTASEARRSSCPGDSGVRARLPTGQRAPRESVGRRGPRRRRSRPS